MSELTSVVDAGVELDDDGAATDGLEEVGRRLHRAAAAGLVRAAGAHVSRVGGYDESAGGSFGGFWCWAWFRPRLVLKRKAKVYFTSSNYHQSLVFRLQL